MEELLQRFPDLCSGIFDQLDNQNLVKSKEVAVSWCKFINFKISWIRMIQKYGNENIKENPDTWRKVMFNEEQEIVKKVAIGLELFDKHYDNAWTIMQWFMDKGTNVSPIDTVVYSGYLQCRQILEKLKTPGNKNG